LLYVEPDGLPNELVAQYRRGGDPDLLGANAAEIRLGAFLVERSPFANEMDVAPQDS
jgi:hypothetical protein